MKKIWLMLVAMVSLTVLLCGLSLSVSAATANGTDGDIGWSFDSNTGILVISGNGEMKDYDKTQDTPWYQFRSDVKIIEIEEGLTYIGNYSFAEFEKVHSIYIRKDVAEIGSHAFEGCVALEKVNIYGNTLDKIGMYAFAGCSALTKIALPAEVSYIYDFAFANTGLVDVQLVNVWLVGQGAFSDCANLERIIIPGNVRYFGKTGDEAVGVFDGCSSLKKIIFCREVPTLVPNDSRVGWCDLDKAADYKAAKEYMATFDANVGHDFGYRFSSYNSTMHTGQCVCGKKQVEPESSDEDKAKYLQEHTYSTYNEIEGSDGETYHMAYCKCGVSKKQEHSFVIVDESSFKDSDRHLALCACGKERMIAHEYGHHYGELEEGDPEYDSHETHHKAFCACGAYELQEHDHSYRYVRLDKNDKDYESYHLVYCMCGSYHEEAHDAWEYDETQHWRYCICAYQRSEESHDFTYFYEEVEDETVGKTQHRAYCECGVSELQGHGIDHYVNNETQHQTVCICGRHEAWVDHDYSYKRINKSTHSAACVCGFGKTEGHTHETYSNEGAKEYYHKILCVCGDFITDWHAYTEGYESLDDYRHNALCVCGKGNAEEHDAWTMIDANKHGRNCVCGVEPKEKAHEWGNYEIEAPTHTVFGKKIYSCVDCEATKEEQIPKLTEHTYTGNWQNHDKEQHKRFCECGDVKYEAHSWDSGEITKAPTHMKEGVKTFTCKGCAATRTETVAALTEQHVYGKWAVDGEQHTRECTCGDTVHEEHVYGEWSVVRASTTQTEGERSKTCTACGTVVTEAIPVVSTEDGMTTGELIGVVFSFVVLFGAAGFWIVSPQLMSNERRK